MRCAIGRTTVVRMPRREPIDPQGVYHVSSRGCYGRTLFENEHQHERFLTMYGRVARKYGWETPSWALMKNHHHFVIGLTEGGLSEGMRELHGGYSRWIHEIYGQTRQGHLFRHAFFARRLKTESAVVVACVYVDSNAAKALRLATAEEGRWCSYPATVGLEHPRPFHTPATLLQMIHDAPAKAQVAYREIVQEGLVL